VENWFMQLKGVCACRGESWAEDLASRVRTRQQWPSGSERVMVIARVKVEDLARDERLRERLAVELVEWAAKRWGHLIASGGCHAQHPG
jgi:hypothetical protein